MSKIGQGGQVVDATGEGVRLRPLAAALSDAPAGSQASGSRCRASSGGSIVAMPCTAARHLESGASQLDRRDLRFANQSQFLPYPFLDC